LAIVGGGGPVNLVLLGHMPIVCPNCGLRSIARAKVFLHAAVLREAWAPITCVKCHERSFVSLSRPKVYWAVGVLVFGFLASYPAAYSSGLFARLPPFVLAAIRLEIWAMAILVATAVVAFGSPLQKLDEQALATRRATLRSRVWVSPLRTLFIASLGVYLYVLFRQIPHVP
jgi:hypothetical protein